jgi:DNA-binding HxlR family transcriptional regulator
MVHFIMQLTILDPVERKSFSEMRCSVAQCLEVIGEWWSMLIVRDAFHGVRRFDDFQSRLGIARNVLADRLGKLVAAGVLDKQLYQENPPRWDYVLTEKGRDLWPVMTSMRQWGDKHAAPHGPPMKVVHERCGHEGLFVLHCGSCGEAVSSRDVRLERGPGAARVPRGSAKAPRARPS